MADLIISPLIKSLCNQLAALAKDAVSILWSIDEDIGSLTSNLETIQAYVADAEHMQSDEAVVHWLRSLKKVAYRAEDTIDEFTTKLRLKLEVPNTFLSSVSSGWARFKQVYFILQTGIEIKKINQELEKILILGSRLGLNARQLGQVAQKINYKRPPTGPCLTEPRIYGREIDKHKLMNMLLHDVEGGDVSVNAIVGMGGLGKTTLAQVVYNEIRGFDKKIWVCVAEAFDVQTIIQSAIEHIKGDKCELSQVSSLQHSLWKLLHRKKYLLVLDDVWNEDAEKWDMLMAPFRMCGSPGSKILVTTRSLKVVQAMHVRNFYTLKPLLDNDCWSLFQQRAFEDGEAKNYPKLVKIGREIAKKSRGLPLAAKVLGGFLFSNRDEHFWLSIKDTEISNLHTSDGLGILPVLKLSYNHLPPHLKQCFVYCSLYPKDFEIDVQDLILQWMAHGFILPKGGRRLEDIGYEYFNDLLWRAMFQDETKDELGDFSITKCKMHDLIHDLAQSVSGGEFSIMRPGDIRNMESESALRHLTLTLRADGQNSLNDPDKKALYKLQCLRTLFIPTFYYNFPDVMIMCSTLRYLRVLYLQSLEGTSTKSIEHLIHLRYLNVGRVDSIPDYISNMLNMQSLILGSVTGKLPKDLSRLKDLRHLVVKRLGRGWSHMPANVGQMTCLQTLSIFIVSKQKGFRIDELGALDKLGSCLKISQLENVSSIEEAKQANLNNKQRLQSLELHWSRKCLAQNEGHVLEGLKPHQNLRKLRIFNYSGDCLPTWLGHSVTPFFGTF